MSRKSYTVTATREEGWWVVEAKVGKRTIHTQAKRLDRVKDVAREAIGMALDVPEDSFDVTVKASLTEALTELIELFITATAEARTAQEEASAIARRAARALNDEGLTVRDAGELLGLSHQRVAQLLAS